MGGVRNAGGGGKRRRRGGGGRRVYSCHGWPYSQVRRPSHPCNAELEHIGFSPTRNAFLEEGEQEALKG